VFDRILIEELPKDKITFCVRGFPVLNDATMDDAKESSLTSIVKVIDSGTDLPGIIQEECSNEFNDYFNNADLIIAKGQGNYETLHESSKNIFFLFKVKCLIVAKQSSHKLGDSAIISKFRI